MKAYEYIVRGKDKISSMMKSIAKTAGVTDSALDNVTRKGAGVDKAFKKSSISSRLFAGSLGFLKTMLLTVSTAMVGLGIFGLVSGMIKLGAEAEQTRIQFQTLTQSVEVGNRLFDELNDFANVTPFNNRDLQKNANTLLAFGTNAGDVVDTLQMLGDVSGGNKEKLNSLTLAYSQVQSMGKLMGQDLLQMINAGFNPLNEISQRTGESMASLKDKMSKGQISADMVTESFKAATSEGGMFNGMMEKMSGTLTGKWSTMVGLFQTNLSEIGLMLAPMLHTLIDFGIRMVQFMPPLVEWFMNFGYAVKQNADVVAILGVGVLALNANLIAATIKTKAQALWTSILAAKQWLLNAAMTANPIGLVIAAIAALVAGFIIAYRRLDWFRGLVLGTWEVMKGFANLMREYVVTRLMELVNAIKGVGETLWHVLNGRFKKAFESHKNTFKNLVGVDSKKQMFEGAKGLGEAFTDGYDKGVNKVVKNPSIGKKFNFGGAGALGGAGADYMAGAGIENGGTTGGNATAGTSSITGGGSKQTNITVNLGKLQDQTVIQSNTVQEGVANMEEMIMQAMLRVMNSVNQMQTT